MSRAKAAVDRAVAALLAGLMSVAVANVVWQVVARYVLAAPSSFTDELARYLLVWIGLVGAAYAAGQRLHVAMDLLPERAARRFRAPLACAVHGAVLAFALLAMGFGGAKLVALSFSLGQTTAALGVSLGWIYLVVPGSGLLLAFYAVCSLLEDLGEDLRGAGDG